MGKRAAHGRTSRERGAAAVETALVLPLLLALVFGVVEFGWVMDQQQDVRHDTHDAARIAALDFGTSEDRTDDELIAFLCDRFDLRDTAEIALTLPDGSAPGDVAVITMTREIEQLTGIFGTYFTGATVESTARSVLEKDVNFNDIDTTCLLARAAAASTP